MQLDSLSWFPGHMTKTRRMITAELGNVDAVCEILDARIPMSSRNPDVDELTAGKPRLIVLNRVDQADPEMTKKWAAYFRSLGYAVIETDAKQGGGVKQFSSAVRTLLREGNLVTLGSDIAGGALLAMNKVITMSIRASKFRHMQTDGRDEFLTVEEGYYLGSSAGHESFGGHGGFFPGDKLHAIVLDDADFTEAAHPLTVRERFERAIYMMHRHNIVSVWSAGKNVVS